MQDIFYNQDLEELFSEEQDTQDTQETEDKGGASIEKEYDYDNVDEDLSELDTSYLDEDMEDLDEDEKLELEFLDNRAYNKYMTNKLHKSGLKMITDLEDVKLLDFYSKKNGVPLGVLAGVHYAETHAGKIKNQTSSAGAVGPMQFMKATAKQYNLLDRTNKEESFRAASEFLRDNFKKTKNWPDAVAAYNAGPGNVKRWRNIKETAKYVPKVMEYAKFFNPEFTKQIGGDVEELPVYQTYNNLKNPFNRYDTNGRSLFTENTNTQIPFMESANHIGYSPARNNLQAVVPADFGRYWNQSGVQYSPDNTANTTINTTGTGAFNAGMAMAGLSNPVTAVTSGADKVLTNTFDGLNKAYNVSKDIRNLIAKTADAGLTGAISILSEKENDRLFNKQLKNMYRESIRDYYKT